MGVGVVATQAAYPESTSVVGLGVGVGVIASQAACAENTTGVGLGVGVVASQAAYAGNTTDVGLGVRSGCFTGRLCKKYPMKAIPWATQATPQCFTILEGLSKHKRKVLQNAILEHIWISGGQKAISINLLPF